MAYADAKRKARAAYCPDLKEDYKYPMLKIIPVQNKTEQAQFCLQCQTKDDPRAFCYQITVDEKTVGICLFSLRGKTGRLDALRNTPDAEDVDALFIAGRQALNFMELSGAKDATADETTISKDLLRRIGFRQTEQGMQMHIAGFFNAPCQHTE